MTAATAHRRRVLPACARLPHARGVYRFSDAAGRVLYVGRATDLRSRVESYWGDLSGRGHLRRMVPRIARVEALVCASAHEASWLERNLLERSLPRWNRVRGGAEVPFVLLVDSDRRRPSLQAVPSPIDSALGLRFGPYLGAERTKLALSGILRAWPLPLAGTHLDAAGRSLAEVRGVTPADAPGFLAEIAALLTSDAAAHDRLEVHLLAARERAVGHLAFEVAAQIDRERRAIAWLVALQRVTNCPSGLVVHGFADGLLLTLSADDGRLNRWTLRRSDERAARALVAQTPPEWLDFAARNAELAVRLSS